MTIILITYQQITSNLKEASILTYHCINVRCCIKRQQQLLSQCTNQLQGTRELNARTEKEHDNEHSGNPRRNQRRRKPLMCSSKGNLSWQSARQSESRLCACSRRQRFSVSAGLAPFTTWQLIAFMVVCLWILSYSRNKYLWRCWMLRRNKTVFNWLLKVTDKHFRYILLSIVVVSSTISGSDYKTRNTL